MIKCQICGKEYKNIQPLSKHITLVHNMSKETYYNIYLKQPNEGICKLCGNPTHFRSMDKGYTLYCSKTCQVKAQNNFKNVNHKEQWKTKHQHIEQFEKDNNVTHVYNLVKQYGDKVYEAIKKLNITVIRESKMYQYIDNTNIDLILDYIKNDNKKINSKKVNEYQLNKQYEQDNNCTRISTLINQYGQGWLSLKLPKISRNKNAHYISNDYLPIIQEYASKNHRTRNSKKECELYNIIKQNCTYNVLQADRKTLPHFELDIYIPELKLAFEYNGIKWHSIENGMSINYHLNKSLLCRDKNIRLIHIYESENFKKQAKLAIDLINGIDNYPKNDFNKNNLINNIPEPEIVYQSKRYTVYGVGKLY